MKMFFAFATACLFLLLAPVSVLAISPEDSAAPEMDPASAARLEEAVRLIEARRFAEALPPLERLATDQPENADVFNLLGFAYRNTGDLDRSGPAYERALALQPDHRGALEYQGELFLLQGDAAGAEANLSKLERLCASPCEERDELAEAIQAWRAAHTQ